MNLRTYKLVSKIKRLYVPEAGSGDLHSMSSLPRLQPEMRRTDCSLHYNEHGRIPVKALDDYGSNEPLSIVTGRHGLCVY